MADRHVVQGRRARAVWTDCPSWTFAGRRLGV